MKNIPLFRKGVIPKLGLNSPIRLTLYMNHLLVVYAFVLPISGRALSAIFSTIIILFILRGQYFYYVKKALKNNIVYACLLFFLVHIIWLMGTENFDYAKSTIDDMKYLVYAIFFVSIVEKKFSFFIITAFVLGMLYSELISYLIHFDILPYSLKVFNFEIYTTHQIDNPTPFLDHARYNVLLSISLGITLYSVLIKKSQLWIRIFSSIFIITASINLTLVGGRIGYITYACIIITTFFLVYRYKLIKIMIPLALVVSGFFYFSYNTSDMLQKRIDLTIESTKKLLHENPDYNTSMGYRIIFWIYSFDVIKSNFLWGVGTGDHMDIVRLNAPEKYKSEILYVSHPHNEYIKNFLQFGLIGFLLFLNIYYQIFKSQIEDKTKKSILLIVTTGISVGVLTSIFGSKVYLPLWMLMIAATTTNNNYLKNVRLLGMKNHFLYYCGCAIFYLVIAVMQ